MRSTVVMLILVSSLSVVLSTGSAAVNFEPGKYEITTSTEATGIPAGMGNHTTVQCLTRQNPVPDQAASETCRVINTQTSGNRVSWRVECEQQGYSSTGTGSITYKGDSFSGSFQLSLGSESGNMKINTQMTGRRIGSCQ